MKKQLLALTLAGVMACTAFSGCAGTSPTAGSGNVSGDASAYPTKPVTIIVPWGVGGGADVIARKAAEVGKKYLGQPIIVENHTGASGTVGMGDTLFAADDGYTLCTTTGPLFSLTPKYVNVDYTLDDFTLLKGMRTVAQMWLSNPDKSGINTFDDLKSYGKDHKIKYGTSGGPGSDQYVLASAMFKKMGVDAEAVVFESQAEALNAIVAGQVDLSISTPPAYYDYQEKGMVMAIATFYPEDVETPYGVVKPVKDFGIDVEYKGIDCFAIRSSVPQEVKDKLVEVLNQVYQDEEFTSYMNEMGFPIYEAESDELTQFVQGQMNSMDSYVALIK